MISELEENLGYNQNPEHEEVQKYYNTLIDTTVSKKTLKNIAKDKLKRKMLLKERLEEIAQMRHRLPKISVVHNTGGTYSLNIIC